MFFERVRIYRFSEEAAVQPPVQQWVAPGPHWFYTSAKPRVILDYCKTVLDRNSPVNDRALIQIDVAAARLTCVTEGMTITVELYHDMPEAELTQVVVRHTYDVDSDAEDDLVQDSSSISSSEDSEVEVDDAETCPVHFPVSPFERYYCKLEQFFLPNKELDTSAVSSAAMWLPGAAAGAAAVAAAAAAAGCDGPVEKKPRLTK
jgi:hypothetical protein